MTEEQEEITHDGVEIPQTPPKTIKASGPTGLAPADMTIPAPTLGAGLQSGFGDDGDSEDEDDIDVVFSPDDPVVYFDEHKFRKQADTSMDLLGVAQKNLKGVFDSGMATDPETAILLYTATVNGAAKMIDVARKLADVQLKNAANRKSLGSSSNPKPVGGSQEGFEPPTTQESLPADAAETIANSRFNPR